MKTNALKIAEPCRVDWTKMTPADGGRFCGDCKKVVKNLSSMTEREAKKVLRSANDGQLCVRFLHDRHGNVFFGADAPRPDFVPASMLSRAKRALAVAGLAGLAAASQACSAEADATSALDPSATTEPTTTKTTKSTELYESMGGVAYDPSVDRVDATNEDAGADSADAGADATADGDAAPSADPN